jgi:hypothetical protein
MSKALENAKRQFENGKFKSACETRGRCGPESHWWASHLSPSKRGCAKVSCP